MVYIAKTNIVIFTLIPRFIYPENKMIADIYRVQEHNHFNNMNQYLITAYDFKDEKALERRMEIRPFHLEGAKALKETGNFILGGAIIDDAGSMIGSTMVLQFESDEQLEAWKANEPYITRGIWETVEIKPFKVANV